jgi:hypothetical protein
MQLRLTLAALICAHAACATAQAPDTGPLILRLPASTRAAALGNAWITGRDEDVVFYNPAQLIAANRGGIGVSLARYGSAGTLGSVASAYSGGPSSLSFGWGVQFLVFSAPRALAYPYPPSTTVSGGSVEASGLLATVGSAIVVKTFRVGIAAKYASDRATALPPDAAIAAPRHEAYLGDVGVAHTLLNGVAGLSVQNIGLGGVSEARRVSLPRQAALGWSTSLPVGEFDMSVASQVTARTGWISAGGGVEMGYSWIEGYSAGLRLGARRPETNAERPVAIGATFSGDRLALDYALQFFEGGHTANRMTIRWR